MMDALIGPNITCCEFEDNSLEDDRPPSYKDPGRILFRYDPSAEYFGERVEILDYDGSVFWLVEGGFPDQWVGEHVHLELEGVYVLEGITGHVWKDYFGEYDEEWTFEICRRASRIEIETETFE